MQVQATFAGGLAEHLQAAGGANVAVTQSLRDSISQANAVASTLSKEITEGYHQLMELATQQGKPYEHVFMTLFRVLPLTVISRGT